MKAYEFCGAPFEKPDGVLNGLIMHYDGDITEKGECINLSLVLEPIEKKGTSQKIKKNEFLNWIKEHSCDYIVPHKDIGIICNYMAAMVGKNSRRGFGNKILAGKNIIKLLDDFKFKECFNEMFLLQENDELDDNELIVFYKGGSPEFENGAYIDVGFLFKENEDDLELFFHDKQLANVKNYFAYANLGEKNE